MSMPLPPIAPIAAGPTPIQPLTRSDGAHRPDSAPAFGASMATALDNLDAAQKATDQLARAAATGDLSRVEDLMVASAETQLATQLTVAVRNRAIESFNEIMRMQL
jgi:flagellar hook-basal body complex protein FliE